VAYCGLASSAQWLAKIAVGGGLLRVGEFSPVAGEDCWGQWLTAGWRVQPGGWRRLLGAVFNQTGMGSEFATTANPSKCHP
jgi:hypothetical protein